jgi:hypothetical protein
MEHVTFKICEGKSEYAIICGSHGEIRSKAETLQKIDLKPAKKKETMKTYQ